MEKLVLSDLMTRTEFYTWLGLTVALVSTIITIINSLFIKSIKGMIYEKEVDILKYINSEIEKYKSSNEHHYNNLEEYYNGEISKLIDKIDSNYKDLQEKLNNINNIVTELKLDIKYIKLQQKQKGV